VPPLRDRWSAVERLPCVTGSGRMARRPDPDSPPFLWIPTINLNGTATTYSEPARALEDSSVG
jgi:hypothetical protein